MLSPQHVHHTFQAVCGQMTKYGLWQKRSLSPVVLRQSVRVAWLVGGSLHGAKLWGLYAVLARELDASLLRDAGFFSHFLVSGSHLVRRGSHVPV